MRPVDTDEYSRFVIKLVDAKVEERTIDLERRLGAALEKLRDLQRAREVERQRRAADMAEVARNARISRAAIAANMSVEGWLSSCRKRRRDPTLFPDDRLSRPRWKPKVRT